jgi:hypothetical protein
LLRLVVDPFLCIGIILVILKLSGTTPFNKELLKIISSGLEIMSFVNFKIFTGILKGPTAFEEFSLLISNIISSEVIGFKNIPVADQYSSDRRGADFPGGVHWCATKGAYRHNPCFVTPPM